MGHMLIAVLSDMINQSVNGYFYRNLTGQLFKENFNQSQSCMHEKVVL